MHVFYKLVFVYSCFVCIPIFAAVFKYWLFAKLRAQKKKADLREEKYKEKSIRTVYHKEREQYYFATRDMFSYMMHNKLLRREDIDFIIEKINASLGSFVKDYEHMKFKNTAHEVYVKLKSFHINEYEFSEILSYMENILKDHNIDISNINKDVNTNKNKKQKMQKAL